MAYRTGSVNSYEELLGVLTSACVTAGWQYSDGILYNGLAFLRPHVVLPPPHPNVGEGLLLEGGRGKNGAALTGVSPCCPRLGSPAYLLPQPNFPCVYHIFCHRDPDEVYVFLRHDVDAYYWMAFGISNVPGITGSGLWITATSGRWTVRNLGSSSSFGVNINEYGGIGSSWYSYGGTSGPWWGTPDSNSGQGDAVFSGTICLDTWVFGGSVKNGYANAIEPLIPLVSHSPSGWNAESVMLPIRVHRGVAENKNQVVLEHAHARYLRLNNIEPEQVITIGVDRWKAFPFYRKNSNSPNVARGENHSGTFGWAIRYDGP